jgi:Cu2+-exporting ATPase
LITRGNALESLARATDFVFDKTGTLTTGHMQLAGVTLLAAGSTMRTRDECVRFAAVLEADSSHPIARAIVAAAPAGVTPCCSDVTHVMGAGIGAIVDGVRVRLGSPRFVAELHRQPPPHELQSVAADASVVALGDEHGWIALFTLVDQLRPHAREVMRELARMGKRVHLVSGDEPPAVRRIARELDIAAWLGGASPRDKLDYVGRLQQVGAIVAMVGDGINDVAGLARAQVSIAIGGGADIACGNSDVLLMSGRLDALLAAVCAARATLRVIRQNLAWAFAYNLAAVPLAACGYVTPFVAGIGMAGSSMLVVANALRLLRTVPPPEPVHDAPDRRAPTVIDQA